MRSSFVSSFSAFIATLLLLFCSFAQAFGPSVLVAHFDDKLPGPIGTGGAALGEPIDIPSSLNAIVTEIAPGDNVLRLTRASGTNATRARFELVDGMEVTEGIVRIRFTLTPSNLERYSVTVRESGSSMFAFLSLNFTSGGGFDANDAAGPITVNPLSYTVDQPLRIELRFDMDAGMHEAIINGAPLYTNRAHGITSRGIGRLSIGFNSLTAGNAIDLDDLRVMLDGPLPERILDARFDDHPLGPIGNGGPALGEPTSIDPELTAHVVGLGGGNRALQVHGVAASGSTQVLLWDALDGIEVESGLIEISIRVRFDALDRYIFFVRESGSSAHNFLNLYLNEDGVIEADTTAGSLGAIGMYVAGVPYRLTLGFDQDAGTVEATLNGTPLLFPTPHGVADAGVGRIGFGVSDASLTGSPFMSDDLFMDTDMTFTPSETIFVDGFELDGTAPTR